MDNSYMCINCRDSDSPNDQHRPQAMETFIYMHLKRKARKKNSNLQQASKDGGHNSETNSPRRDTELPDIKNMQWTENAHGIGTIPGHLSIRAPPASIGIGGKKEELIGITNHEVSERYILKLQKDRERNNQAVFKSLENLPITIRHVPKYRIQSEPTIHTARAATGAEARPSSMRSLSPEEISYQRLLNATDFNLNVKSSDTKPVGKVSQELLRSEFKKSKVAGPMCPHLMSLAACRKCARLKRRRKRPDVKKEAVATVTTGILGNDLNIQAEGNGNLSQDTSYTSTYSEPKKVIHTMGFQGHQLRSSKSVKVPNKKKTLTPGLPISGNASFQKKYTRVFDSNQQIHFVNTSLLSSRRVGTLGKAFKTLPGIRAAGESQRLRENTEVFAIKSVQRYNEPFPQISTESMPTIEDDMSPGPLPIQPMHSFASDISDMQMINLDGRVHGEPSDGDKVGGSFTNTHDYSVPKSDIGLQNAHKTQKDRHVPMSRSDSEVLACRARHMTPGKTDTKSSLYTNETGNYEDVHQKGRSRLNKATCRQHQDVHNSKVAPEMQFSVRIEYKQTEDEPTPRECTFSEVVNVPRWVEREKSNVDSIEQKSTRGSPVGDMFQERGHHVSDIPIEGGINNFPLSKEKSSLAANPLQKLQSNDFDGKRGKDGVGFCDKPVSLQEMVDRSDSEHAISQNMVSELSGESISVRSDDKRNTNVPSKELRQKSSPESGFVSIPGGSDEITVETDESTYESAETVTDSEGKRMILKGPDLKSGEGQIEIKADDNKYVETKTCGNSVVNGSDIIHINNKVSGHKDDKCSNQPTDNESPDSMSEMGGGFFVTTLDHSEQGDADNKGVPSRSDSGIAQDDLNLLQEYTNEDLHVASSSQNVMRPSRIGIGLSHDIQA